MRCICIIVLVIGFGAQGNAPAQPAAHGPATASTAVEREIQAARLQIQKDPKRVQAHNDLALALVRKADETLDPSDCIAAGQALQPALQLAPDNFQVLKTQTAFLLCSHRFADARKQATMLNRRNPDDVAVYGYLATADIALGNYQEAESEAQWMLNLLPNNVPGLLIGADLRNLFGDADGALDFLNQAYSETAPTQVEELASIAQKIAAVDLQSGKFDPAEQALKQSLSLIPETPGSLRLLAQLRFAQRRYAEALVALRRFRSADPANAYLEAKSLEAAGDVEQAKRTFAMFEHAAVSQVKAPANANRELIFYYADHENDPAKALAVAQYEHQTRHDVYTQDAYAWALHTSGRDAEARAVLQTALGVGIRDAELLYHAGKIAGKLDDAAEATRDFQASLQINPASPYAAEIRKLTGMPEPVPAQADAVSSSRDRKTALNSKAAVPAIMQAGRTMTARPATLTDGLADGSKGGVLAPVPARLLTPQPTETDRLIRATQTQVARNPDEPSGYAKLGAAFFQRARETGDVAYYEQSEQALTKALDMVSNDFSAFSPTMTLAEVCMGEHRFDDALANAEKALSLGSGDLSPYAIVGDAYTDMGDYEKGAAAYAKLQQPDKQDRSGNSYVADSRLSFLRFLSGDTAAAINLMQSAVTDGTQARLPGENLAWLYFELGEYYFQAGKMAEADSSYLRALTIHPGDYRALAGLGKVRAGEGHTAEAIELYTKAIAVVPMPIYIAELGDLYTRVGNTVDAKKQFQLVEYIGLLGNINKVLHNRDLALFYADHDTHLERALELAHKEFEVRRDIYTWDALAWALYKNGKPQQAADAIANAIRLGTKDALLLYHAGTIYQKLGQQAKADAFFSQALTINPHFHLVYADVARRELAKAGEHAVQVTSREPVHVQ